MCTVVRPYSIFKLQRARTQIPQTAQMDPNVKQAAQVTLGYLGAYVIAIGAQVYGKVRAHIDHGKTKATDASGKIEPFNRYTSTHPLLMAGDRAVGNAVEWMGPFLASFWLAATIDPSPSVFTAGWIYVALRSLYPFLAFSGGVKRSGAGPLIFLSTVPQYVVIIFLAYTSARKVFA